MPRIANRDAKALIIEAARKSFYDLGFDQSSVDTIALRAGVTKRAIYYHYADKTALLHAALQAAQDPALLLLQSLVGPAVPGSEVSLFRLMSGLRKVVSHPSFNGCLFLRSAQAFRDDHAVINSARAHKQALHQWLQKHVSEIGVLAPEALADQLHLVIDMALSSAHLYPHKELFRRLEQSLELAIAQLGIKR
jgi:AcrR family transcriptional regulator